MKGIIIYQGTYGSTKQYAQWIAEELNFNCFPASEWKNAPVEEYDTVVVGSSVKMGSLSIKKWLNRNWPRLQNRKVVLFSVSGTGPDEKGVLQDIQDKSIPSEIQKKISFFSFRGRQEMKKFPAPVRFILKMLASTSKDPNMKKFLASDWDFVDRDSIAPLVDSIKNQ